MYQKNIKLALKLPLVIRLHCYYILKQFDIQGFAHTLKENMIMILRSSPFFKVISRSFLTVGAALLLILSLPSDDSSGMSLDKSGKWIGWDTRLDPPASNAIEKKFSSESRKYTFKGTGYSYYVDGGTHATPGVYFDYSVAASYDIDTETAKETITISGSNPPVNPPLYYTGTYRSSKDPWLQKNVQCSIVSQSGSLMPYVQRLGRPLSAGALTSSQMAMFKKYAIEQAKILEIAEPRENAQYSSKNDMLFMVKQRIPDDLEIPAVSKIMLDIRNMDNPSKSMAKIIQSSGSGHVWLKTLPIEPGTWRVRSYIYSPIMELPANALWRSFVVTEQTTLGKPPVQPPLSILEPKAGSTVLQGNNLAVHLSFGQPVKPGQSLIDIILRKYTVTAPGQWPKPPEIRYQQTQSISSSKAILSIPGDALVDAGNYQLEIVFFPNGKSGANVISSTAKQEFKAAGIKMQKIKRLSNPQQ
ncbi:MAG: hypothetical protein K4305_06450 [Chlorobium sp.]|uniref:hypothetical protein n=1 Tax=Chlorobium sp. TaxID=1095 RepID=UPI002F3EA7FC